LKQLIKSSKHHIIAVPLSASQQLSHGSTGVLCTNLNHFVIEFHFSNFVVATPCSIPRGDLNPARGQCPKGGMLCILIFYVTNCKRIVSETHN